MALGALILGMPHFQASGTSSLAPKTSETQGSDLTVGDEADKNLVGSHQAFKASDGEVQAVSSRVAKSLTDDSSILFAPQFFCATPAVQQSCPSLTAQLGHQMHLDVPADARWYFEGPSYMAEVWHAIVAANGVQSVQGAGSLDCTDGVGVGAEQPNAEFKGTHLMKVVLENGAILVYADASTDDATFKNEAWTHGFFMEAHNDAYFDEHVAAAQQHRKMNIHNFEDAQGRDMCLAGSYRFGDGPTAPHTVRELSDVPNYLNCTDSYPQVVLFKERMRKIGASFTHVVPWQLVTPPGGSKGLHTGGARMYFPRERAVESNCMAVRHDGPMQANGFRKNVISSAAQNPRGETVEHQCIVACEGGIRSDTSCYPGALLWMAHDLIRGL